MEFRQYIYVSRLSGSIGETGMRQIMQRSRDNNSTRDLTGALLFDGESFVQLLEGSSDEVMAMVVLIRDDRRHVDFTTICDLSIAGPDKRLCRDWRNGYIEPGSLDSYRARVADLPADSPDSLQGFMALLSTADMN